MNLFIIVVGITVQFVCGLPFIALGWLWAFACNCFIVGYNTFYGYGPDEEEDEE